MTTARTTDRQIVLQDIYLMRGDEDDDILAYGDLDDETLLVSTGNATDWTKRTNVTTSRTPRTPI